VAAALNVGIDILLGTMLLWVALAALAGDVYRGIILFIVFGLLAAMAWVRLDAPDLAIAEAAVGAGITGVLLLGTLGWMKAGGTDRGES
jgi:uncharacterized MnhB-related membrane protein